MPPEGRDPRVRSFFLIEQIRTTCATGVVYLRPTAIFLWVGAVLGSERFLPEPYGEELKPACPMAHQRGLPSTD